MNHRTHRRDFLRNSAYAGFGIWVAHGATARGRSANETVRVGIIGAGGQGGGNTKNVAAVEGVTIAALCDVDAQKLGEAAGKFPGAKTYADFRKLLEGQKDLDAVVVSTPDHVHAFATVMALDLGKHVYCEKPLTHSVFEARAVAKAAARAKVGTQMGNQGHSGENTRKIVEAVRAGVIGPIKEVHAWTNRPIWPQGNDRPEGSDIVPEHLDWDLWLGPAPERPFVANKKNPDGKGERKIYHPFAWRGWWDFGTGALGDMACHILDTAFWAADLRNPTAIEAECSDHKPESAPSWSIIRYEFPSRGELPPVKLTWYDGGKKPPEELFEGEKLKEGGSLLIGEKGKIFISHEYGGQHILLPKKDFEGFQAPEPTIPRSPGHHKDWIEACRNPSRPACSNFEYAAALTETVLLGNVALRAGKRLEYDAAAMKATNCPEADQFLKREYRKGWSLPA